MSTCSYGNGGIVNSDESRKKKKQRCSQRRLCKASTRIAIIGTGPSGISSALSLQQAGYQNIHLYERDEHFNARKEGYGLTLTYNPSKNAPLSKLGLLESIARVDCPSRAHYVFHKDGKILGYYGNAFSNKNDNGRGFGQRGNLRVPRQCLRKIMMDELINRDMHEGTGGRKGLVKIHWGKKLVSYHQNQNQSNNDAITGDAVSGSSAAPQNCAELYFQDGSSAKADLLIGADGVRSAVIRNLLSPSTTTNSSSNVDDDIDNSQKSGTEANCSLSYLGIMIVLGITKDFSHSLLDERGFYTLDGEHRLFTMPYEGCRIADLEKFDIPLDENTYNNRTRTTRRYMWQLSYNLSSLDEASNLSQQGPKALLNEVLRRTEGWHNPVKEMIQSTPLETVWGTPLMDRQPTSIHDKVMKDIYNPNLGRTLRTVILGDSIHAMSPFKGQGCNQALMDGPLLSSWLEKSSIDSAIKGFMREMVTRTNKKVMASRDAAKFLHSKEVLSHEEGFAGVRKDAVKPLLQTLEKRNIGAHLEDRLDALVTEVIEELGIYQETSTTQSAEEEVEQQKLALQLASNGDTAQIRRLSLSNPRAIREAKDEKTKETCLHLAAKRGCYHTCRWLVSEASVQINAIDSDLRSPLHSAVLGGNLKVISLICKLSKKYGYSWAVDANGRTPIDIAIHHPNATAMKNIIPMLSEEK